MNESKLHAGERRTMEEVDASSNKGLGKDSFERLPPLHLGSTIMVCVVVGVDGESATSRVEYSASLLCSKRMGELFFLLLVRVQEDTTIYMIESLQPLE
jgi:hypothetical protein